MPACSRGLRNSELKLRFDSLEMDGQLIPGFFSTSRPKTLEDVAAQEHTVNVLQRTLQASNVCISTISEENGGS